MSLSMSFIKSIVVWVIGWFFLVGSFDSNLGARVFFDGSFESYFYQDNVEYFSEFQGQT